MADYSSVIMGGLRSIGDTFANKRRFDRENMEQDRSYSRALGLDTYNQGQDSIANAQRDRALQIQEQNAQRLAQGGDMPSSYVEWQLMQQDPGYKGFLDSRDRKGMSVTEKKEIFSNEDDLTNIGGTVQALTKAKSLIPGTYTGVGASTRGYLGSKLPDWMVPDQVAEPGAANSTAEYQNIMSMEAIKNMAQTLKGATTDFELRKFEQVLADPSTPAKIREATIDRMIALAKRKEQILTERMGGIRDQTYFQPQGGAPASTPQDNPELIEGDLDPNQVIQWAEEAIANGADPAAVRQRAIELGIDVGQ